MDAMSFESLLSMRGSNIIGVYGVKPSDSSLDIIDLVRAKKEATGIYTTTNYDMNGDGVVDDADLLIIRKILLGVM